MITLLDQAIRAANAECGYKTLHRYVLFLHFGIDAFYKMKRDGVIKNAKFISAVMVGNRVQLPENVLAVSKTGLQTGRRILTAIPDDTISIDPTNVGNGKIDASLAPSSDLFAFLQLNSIYFRESLTRPAVVDGSYYAPRFKLLSEPGKKKELIFDRGEDGAKVYVEVVEEGITPGASTIITQDAFLPIKSYIHYRNSRFKHGASSVETKAAQEEYDDELEEAAAAQSNLTGNTILNALSLRYGTF